MGAVRRDQGDADAARRCRSSEPVSAADTANRRCSSAMTGRMTERFCFSERTSPSRTSNSSQPIHIVASGGAEAAAAVAGSRCSSRVRRSTVGGLRVQLPSVGEGELHRESELAGLRVGGLEGHVATRCRGRPATHRRSRASKVSGSEPLSRRACPNRPWRRLPGRSGFDQRDLVRPGTSGSASRYITSVSAVGAAAERRAGRRRPVPTVGGRSFRRRRGWPARVRDYMRQARAPPRS